MSSIVIDGLRWKILTINDRCAFEFGNQITIFWDPRKQAFVVVDATCSVIYRAKTSDLALERITKAIYCRIANQMTPALA